MADSVRAFILQPSYRVEGERPVVHLYGRLEDGRTFLLRDTRQVPHFYVRAADAERARAMRAKPLAPAGQTTLEGEPVVRVEVATPADAPPLRQRLIQSAIPCYEADVRFAMRFLIDRKIKGALLITGASRDEPGVGAVFDDPHVTPSDWTPRLSVLSFDIETDPRARRLLSIGLHGAGASEVLILNPAGWEAPAGAVPFATEKELLAGFAARVRELDPDILTGWNIVDFDLPVLVRLAQRHRVALHLGRGPGPVRLRSQTGAQAQVPGRVILDGLYLVRGAFIRLDDYTLDGAAREILGEGKHVAGPDRAEEILRLFADDRPRFVEYNRTDARLVLDIVEKLHLVELAIERSRLTGMPLDRVSSSIAAFDFLYLSELGLRNVVAPSVRAVDVESMAGGHVLEPIPGLHRNVAVLDFRSLYPSLIRTFQIDPWNLVRSPTTAESDVIRAPNGAAFHRRPGILTEMLDEIMPRREAALRAGDAVRSHAIKILMNSFYGVLGTPACRFYDARLANAITSFGKEILLWCKRRIEASGRRVLYGDTDSLFVESGEVDADAARGWAEALVKELMTDLAAHIDRTWGVPSRLQLQFDRLYLRLYLPALRHGTAGARKRYAGLVHPPGGSPRVVFTGMEAVRGDWTELAKQVQRELYGRLFADQPVEEYLRAIVADVRAARSDELLVYRKSLRKDPSAYTATTPPHVAAARQIAGKTKGRVAYVVTVAGPEPADDRRHPLDYEHYVEKQVKAVAEPVLALLGLDFARVVGDDRQMSLF
jgi:DNA polymerase-2